MQKRVPERVLKERGIMHPGVGIRYIDSNGNESIYRMQNDEEVDRVADYIRNYIDEYTDGCYLNLPGGDLNYPMQVEFLFGEKDRFPHLYEAYTFFKDLNEKTDDISAISLLMSADEEDIRKYKPA